MKINNKLIFYYCSLYILIVFVVMPFFPNIDSHIDTQTVSTINFTAPIPTTSNVTAPTTTSNVTAPTTTSTTDAIGIALNNIRSDNMDKLMNQTMLPFMDKPTSTITATSNNLTQGETEINQPTLTSNSSDMITDNNDQTKKTAIDDSANLDPVTQSNNPIPLTDNQAVLLQFQDPAGSDTINKLQRIENMIYEQAAVVENATKTATKSVQESNNRIMQDLSKIRSSINSSDSLTDRIMPIQKSNNKIMQDVSELKSSVIKSSSSYISPPVIGGIVAAMVSTAVILLFLRMGKTDVGVKFNELRFKRKYR